MSGIPTTYNGINFRSRIEAKWAAFFDDVGWRWEYEPFDLSGYIPDFVLLWKEPVIVEVKSCVTREELAVHSDKILQSGWKGEFLLLGGCLFEAENFSAESIGLLYEPGCQMLDDACSQRCLCCKRISIFHATGSYHCRVSGCQDGDHYLGTHDVDVAASWKRVINAVQWKPRKHAAEEQPAKRNWNHD